jgi:hypothetical protein
VGHIDSDPSDLGEASIESTCDIAVHLGLDEVADAIFIACTFVPSSSKVPGGVQRLSSGVEKKLALCRSWPQQLQQSFLFKRVKPEAFGKITYCPDPGQSGRTRLLSLRGSHSLLSSVAAVT